MYDKVHSSLQLSAFLNVIFKAPVALSYYPQVVLLFSFTQSINQVTHQTYFY
jgi:hypothetical protein